MTKKVKAIKAWALMVGGKLAALDLGSDCFFISKTKKTTVINRDDADGEEVVEVEIRPVKPIKRRGK